jgi:uroporphyrin-III C-methyltransferase
MTGKFYLVGAGPGDPELLTVKATRLLKAADVVLHDDLVAPEILKLVPVQAQLHNVGKRCGKKKISQEEINFLMIGQALLGMTVVRLKSGDPLIFGRGGEEIEALRNAGIEFEIVPGVTSAFGAAASSQIPLTHRRISPAVILLTAQRAGGNEESDWRKFVTSGATLVIYMPGHHYSEIAKRLRTAGAVAETPCAIISRATTPNQQTFVTSLQALHRAPHLPAPTLLVVGEVVRFSRDSEPHLPDMQAPFETVGPAARTKEGQEREEESVA